MTTFNSMVSRFAHEHGEGSSSPSSPSSPSSLSSSSSSSSLSSSSSQQRKRARPLDVTTSNQLSAQDSETPKDEIRKSLRVGTTHSRVIGVDSIKSKPHHRKNARLAATSSAASTSRVTIQFEDLLKETYDTKDKDDFADEVDRLITKAEVKSNRSHGYSPPEVYAHLPLLPDIIDYDLDVLWVGINPGVKSSEKSHHFSGPTNHFWPCLNDSGLLPPGVRLGPKDDRTLPRLYNMGLTNLVDRPSRSGAELSATEARAAAPVLMAKIKKFRPRFVCFVSKQAWDMFSGVGLGLQTAWVSWYDEPEDDALMTFAAEMGGHGRTGQADTIQQNLDEEGYRVSPFFEKGPSVVKLEQDLAAEDVPEPYRNIRGQSAFVKREEDDIKVKTETMSTSNTPDNDDLPQCDQSQNRNKQNRNREDSPPQGPRRGAVRGSRMFVMPSTSGRVTQYRKEDKLAFFKQLAELVRRDRQLRGL